MTVTRCDCGAWVEFDKNGILKNGITHVEKEVNVDQETENTFRGIEVAVDALDDDGNQVVHFFDGEGIYFGLGEDAAIVYDGDGGVIGYFPKNFLVWIMYVS